MIDQAVAVAIFTALGTLSAAVAFQRWRGESTVGRASPGAPSPRGAMPATMVGDRAHQGPGALVAGPKTRVWYGAEYQVNDFVSVTIASGGCDRWRDQSILRAYHAWARDGHIDIVADAVFLAKLARHPHVKRTRDRLKNDKGRVIYLPSGTPMRGVFYTISERPYAVVPDGVAMPKKVGVRASPKKVAKAGVRKGPGRVQAGSEHPKRIAA